MSSPRNGPSTPHTISPSHPVLLATQSQWLFTDEELTRTPSCLDGLPLPTEHASRSKAVNFILQVGLILKLPQNTLFTASIYMHRFFMRYSMKDIPGRPGMHPYAVAATALFLATKVDENCRKMKEYVIACCRVGLKNPNLIVDEQSKEFWRWRDTILHNEDLLLEALCFDLQLELPHRFLWDFMAHFRLRDNKNLRNAAWAFLNDSMYTVLCLQFPARTIAAAALYAAARHVGVRLPDDADTGAPWWEQLQLHLADLRTVCNRLADVYEGLTFPNPNAKNSHYYERMPVGLAQVDEASDPTRSLGFLPQTPPPAMPLGVGVGAGVGASVSPELNGGRKREREREESAGLGDVAKRQRVEDGGQSRVPSRPARSLTPSAPPEKLNGTSSRIPPQAQAQAQAHAHASSRIPHPLPPPPPVIVSPNGHPHPHHHHHPAAPAPATAAGSASSSGPASAASSSTYPHRPFSPPALPPIAPPQTAAPVPPSTTAGGGSTAAADEVQQKIDAIVQSSQAQAQAQAQGQGQQVDTSRGRGRDREWDRDRERERNREGGRGRSISSSMQGHQQPPQLQPQLQLQPEHVPSAGPKRQGYKPPSLGGGSGSGSGDEITVTATATGSGDGGKPTGLVSPQLPPTPAPAPAPALASVQPATSSQPARAIHAPAVPSFAPDLPILPKREGEREREGGRNGGGAGDRDRDRGRERDVDDESGSEEGQVPDG